MRAGSRRRTSSTTHKQRAFAVRMRERAVGCTTSNLPVIRLSTRKPKRRTLRSRQRRDPASKNVTRTPSARSRAQVAECFNQHGGLHRHVQGAGDSHAGGGLPTAIFSRIAIRPGISLSAMQISFRPKIRQIYVCDFVMLVFSSVAVLFAYKRVQGSVSLYTPQPRYKESTGQRRCTRSTAS